MKNTKTKAEQAKRLKQTNEAIKAALRELLTSLDEEPLTPVKIERARSMKVKTKPAPKKAAPKRAFASLYGADVPGLEGLERSQWEPTFRKVAAALDKSDTAKATALLVTLPLAARDTDEWGACADGVFALSGDVVDFYAHEGRR